MKYALRLEKHVHCPAEEAKVTSARPRSITWMSRDDLFCFGGGRGTLGSFAQNNWEICISLSLSLFTDNIVEYHFSFSLFVHTWTNIMYFDTFMKMIPVFKRYHIVFRIISLPVHACVVFFTSWFGFDFISGIATIISLNFLVLLYNMCVFPFLQSLGLFLSNDGDGSLSVKILAYCLVFVHARSTYCLSLVFCL